MARAVCRCGEPLKVPREGTDRMVCPKCGAKVRVRRASGGEPAAGDGFIRFLCPCGRRLKVGSKQPPTHGRCPECGRTVPVPASGVGLVAAGPETETAELNADQLAGLERWVRGYNAEAVAAVDRAERHTPVVITPPAPMPAVRAEAGLRICPQCKKPVHLGADHCRTCGIAVPRKV